MKHFRIARRYRGLSRVIPFILAFSALGTGCWSERSIDELPPGAPRGFVHFSVHDTQSLRIQVTELGAGSVPADFPLSGLFPSTVRLAAVPGIHHYRAETVQNVVGEAAVCVREGETSTVEIHIRNVRKNTEKHGRYHRVSRTFDSQFTIDPPVSGNLECT